MEKTVKKKKRKLNIRGLIFIILLLYLIGSFAYYLFTLPVKNIKIENNNLVLEKDIINALNIEENTPLYKISTSKLKKNLETVDLINDVKIKKSLKGLLTINIIENKILYYNVLTKNYMLSNGKETIGKYIGVPTLVNYIPSEFLEKFIISFSKVDKSIISIISEIEYCPEEYNGTIIDAERFLLRMNDGNSIYINTINLEKLNKYPEVYVKVGSGGTLYLDSSSNNFIFKKGK